MVRVLSDSFGNPASVHWHGLEAKKVLDRARQQVADFMHALPSEIIFTSCGTEANNLALFGVFAAAKKKKPHLIVSAIEHPSVLECARSLRHFGAEISEVRVDSQCLVDPEDIVRAIRPDTVLISVMLVNNQVGTIQPAQEIARLARERAIPFHCDAVQAAGRIPLDVEQLGADLLTISAHKLYGPKGAAALYLRRGTALKPLVYGGHQENRRRAGTVNVPALAGFGEACRLATEELPRRAEHDTRLRQRLEAALGDLPGLRLLGHPTRRAPHISAYLVEDQLGEMFVLGLDQQGISASSGSACTSGQSHPSHVLLAMGLDEQAAAGAVRFSVGAANSDDDIDAVVKAVRKLLAPASS